MADSTSLPSLSTFYFPLRTNVAYFDAPENSLNLLERIKQASLLYDKLIFEAGIFLSVVIGQEHHDQWVPREQYSDEGLEALRTQFEPYGGTASVTFQDPVTGEVLHHVSGPVTRRFMCEFHTVLGDLEAGRLPWIEIETYDLNEVGKQAAQDVYRSLRQGLAVQQSDFLTDKMLKDFSTDLILSSELGAAASTDSIYSRFLAPAGVPRAPGFSAFQVVIPNLAHLPWDEVLKLREEDCLVQFRQKMVAVEAEVGQALLHGELEEARHQHALARAFMEEFATELFARQPSGGQVAGQVALDVMAAPIPYLSTAVNAARGLVDLQNSQQSWTAAFFKMRAPRS